LHCFRCWILLVAFIDQAWAWCWGLLNGLFRGMSARPSYNCHDSGFWLDAIRLFSHHLAASGRSHFDGVPNQLPPSLAAGSGVCGEGNMAGLWSSLDLI